MRASSLLMLRETSVAIISFRSTWVTPEGATGAGAASVGSTATAATAPAAKAVFIRLRNIMRHGAVIALPFHEPLRGDDTTQPRKAAIFSLLGRRGHERHFANRIEIGQQGRKQAEGGQIRGQDVDEFDAGAVGNPTPRRRTKAQKPKREAEKQARNRAD